MPRLLSANSRIIALNKHPTWHQILVISAWRLQMASVSAQWQTKNHNQNRVYKQNASAHSVLFERHNYNIRPCQLCYYPTLNPIFNDGHDEEISMNSWRGTSLEEIRVRTRMLFILENCNFIVLGRIHFAFGTIKFEPIARTKTI